MYVLTEAAFWIGGQYDTADGKWRWRHIDKHNESVGEILSADNTSRKWFGTLQLTLKFQINYIVTKKQKNNSILFKSLLAKKCRLPTLHRLGTVLDSPCMGMLVFLCYDENTYKCE